MKRSPHPSRSRSLGTVKASTSPLLNLGYRKNRRNVKIAMLDAAS
jgi:hypothetical protein